MPGPGGFQFDFTGGQAARAERQSCGEQNRENREFEMTHVFFSYVSGLGTTN